MVSLPSSPQPSSPPHLNLLLVFKITKFHPPSGWSDFKISDLLGGKKVSIPLSKYVVHTFLKFGGENMLGTLPEFIKNDLKKPLGLLKVLKLMLIQGTLC